MTMTAQEVKLLTADDLLRLYSKGVRGELIRGVLCKTMAVGGEHGETVVNLVTELGNFAKPRRLGRLAASDSGVFVGAVARYRERAGHSVLLFREDTAR